MAVLIPADYEQDMKTVNPKNGENFSLDELQGFVGGLIEIVDYDGEIIMVVNKEGKGVLPMNRRASQILGWDWVAGDVILCRSDEVR